MSTDITIYQGDHAIVPYTKPSHYVLSLDATVAAWLKNKSERTGSAKTRRAYGDTIDGFRAMLQAAHPVPLDLDSDDTPPRLTPIRERMNHTPYLPHCLTQPGTLRILKQLVNQVYPSL